MERIMTGNGGLSTTRLGRMHERLFAPLGMKDTAFFVPQEKLGGFATVYTRDHVSSALKMFDDPATGKFAQPPVFENGSAGLVSTADDFNAFAQMMLNGGRLGSERILSRPPVELMTTDQLSPEQKLGSDCSWAPILVWACGFPFSPPLT